MKFTTSIKRNHEFQRLYGKGKNAVSPFLAVYCRKNRKNANHLGFTVGKKVGGAVTRNRVRRRLREIYRLHEGELRPGWDIVIVSRARAAFTSYQKLEDSFLRLSDKLGLLRGGQEGKE